MRMKWLDEYQCWVFDDGRVAVPSVNGLVFKKIYLCPSNPYKTVKINGKTEFLHRLIAIAFVPNPNNNPVVDHINRCKTDNDISNLRWVSYRENSANTERISNRNYAISINSYTDHTGYMREYMSIHRSSNREAYNQYMRAYRRRKKEAGNA